MFTIGCHLSVTGGFSGIARDAASIGANTFQFFTRNPRGGSARALSPDDLAAYADLAEAAGLHTPLAHAPYTLNACGKEERVLEFARQTMADDLLRMEQLPGTLYNFHPGSHVGQGMEAGIDRICQTLNAVLAEDQTTTVLLETMSGKGSEVGSRFEELRAIIDGTRLSSHLGVCLDTCHVYDAGYDIVDDLDGVLAEFDRIIGSDRLRAVHLNDSKNPRGSHKDRHEQIGKGSLGEAAFGRIINHPALRALPFYLETPCELAGYAGEIRRLRELRVEDQGEAYA